MTEEGENSSDKMDLTMHKLVFSNNIAGLSKLLNSVRNNEPIEHIKDHHGNTALHLAVMLGHKECTQLLLKHGYFSNTKNVLGWTPLHEAISYGDRQIIMSLLRSFRKQREAEKKKPDIKEVIKSLKGDFHMQLKWDFQSWIPFVSRILPSDVCHIYKKNNKFRLDSTLEDFSNRRWIRGDLTYLADFETSEPDILLLDNRLLHVH